jgi:phenylpropionate dioxygenase-like ring-hydroxylating dioxygenase large terminal subunit
MDNPPFEPRLISGLVREDRVHRRLFTDPAIFELEIERIFHRTWVYVGHEGEIPNPGDFKLSRIGLQPVIVVRDRNGTVRVLFNACRHRGITVCQDERGNAKHFMCAYHGWTYDLAGNLVAVPFQEGHPAAFRREDYGLHAPPRVGIHAGFIFASVNPDVKPLPEHLGGAAQFLTDFVELSPTGKLDAQRGVHKFRYTGNWKSQVENSVDGYHAMGAHGSFLGYVLTRRLGRDVSGMVDGRSPTLSRALAGHHGLLDFRMVNRTEILGIKEEDLPQHLKEYRRRLRERLGEERMGQVLRTNGGDGYNLLVYPNLFLIGVQIRTIQPIAVDTTEVYCAPTALDGAPDEINEARLRSHEDFYGPAAFGQPDDMEMFVRQWEGLRCQALEWLLYDRGLERERTDAEGPAAQLTDETAHRALWKHYLSLMAD